MGNNIRKFVLNIVATLVGIAITLLFLEIVFRLMPVGRVYTMMQLFGVIAWES